MKTIRFLLIPFLALAATGVGSASIRSEKLALAVLASNAGIEEKALACQELAVFGGPEAVSALAALLTDEQLAAYARSALEVIEDPAAGEALLAALPTLKGQRLAGVVTSLGVRGGEAAVPALQRLAANPGSEAAEPALTALAHIGTEDALATIQKILKEGPAELRFPAADAALLAADKMTQQGKDKAARKLLKSVRAADLPEHIKKAATELNAR